MPKNVTLVQEIFADYGALTLRGSLFQGILNKIRPFPLHCEKECSGIERTIEKRFDSLSFLTFFTPQPTRCIAVVSGLSFKLKSLFTRRY